MAKVLKRVKGPKGAKASDLWRTPPECYAALHDEFLFGIDLAADAVNHLCPVWLGPGSAIHADALAFDWLDAFAYAETDAGFINFPYSMSEQWMVRIAEQISHMRGCVIVALTPYTPDAKWWRHSQRAVEIREIPHRVKYLKADGKTAAGAMFPSAVMIFRPQPGVRRGSPRHVVWSYRTPKPNPRQHGQTYQWLRDPLEQAATELERSA
jgi:phage N-6-adenine-methyltransferase